MSTRLGILGGGQLGLMLIQASKSLNNLETSVLDPDPDAPCREAADHFVVGSLTDRDTVINFGRGLDIITIEIENVNISALKELQQRGKKVYPQPEIICTIQDKCRQKEFYQKNNIPTADFVVTNSREEVRQHLDNLLPAVHKLAKGGYDGHGVQILRTIDDLDKAFDEPAVLERLIDFEKEISVIAVRGPRASYIGQTNNDVATFPVVESVFHPTANLVEYLYAPAQIDAEVEQRARKLAKDLIECMGLVGTLAVEMFLMRDGSILVNEVAPRVHNSGHHTIEANDHSQFTMHLYAILGYVQVLGNSDTRQNVPYAAMINVLGAESQWGPVVYHGLDEIVLESNTHLHLYGKKLTKPFRKMGHITITEESSLDTLKEKIERVKNLFTAEAVTQTTTQILEPSVPKVGIIMGSQSDLPVMQAAADILDELHLQYEMTIVSAHRTPHRMMEYAQSARTNGINVIIAGAGGAAHLPGMVASLTTLPVIGVPIKSSNSIDGWDSVLSILQMPGGVPVATVALNGAKNAGILAAQIIGSFDETVANVLADYKQRLQDRVMESVAALSN